MSADSSIPIENSELQSDQSSAWKLLFRSYTFAIITFLFILGTGWLQDSQTVHQRIIKTRSQIAASASSETRSLLESHQKSREWIRRYGFSGEVKTFDWSASWLFGSIQGSGISNMKIGIVEGLLRILFLLLALWRIWIVILCIGFIRGVQNAKAYIGEDLLGRTGNGFLFFSGIGAKLKNLTAEGVPDVLVPGLACPKSVPVAIARSSKTAKILTGFHASNETNLHLAAILLAHEEFPAYVAVRGEEEQLQKRYRGASLLENSIELLQRVLSVHRRYQKGAHDSSPDLLQQGASSSGEAMLPIREEDGPGTALGMGDYLMQVQQSLERSLTPGQRQKIGEMNSNLIASAVLGLEAGKVLSFVEAGGRWSRVSNFPQLSARAVLHSLPPYGSEYNADDKQMIRRAFMYGSRSSVFGPVRMLADLSEETHALRQWVEILLACPHELQTVTDEVELYGRIRELHHSWNDYFSSSVLSLENKLVSESYLSSTNLLAVPIVKLVNQIEQFLKPGELDRIHQLIAVVHRKQQLNAIKSQESAEGEPDATYSTDQMLCPIDRQESESLAKEHNVPLDIVEKWSSLRVVLDSFGWLARRIGEYTIPESKIAAIEIQEHGSERLLKTGMAVLRGSKPGEFYGEAWKSRFQQVNRFELMSQDLKEGE